MKNWQRSSGIEKIIRAEIPLTKAMGLRVSGCGPDGFKFQLPLKPNRNHQGTAFGGTLIAAQALCCWAWITRKLKNSGVSAVVVIRRNESRFLRPVDADFTVQVVSPPNAKAWNQFLKDIRESGRGRITLNAEVTCRGKKTVTFVGEYVALPAGKATASKKSAKRLPPRREK